MIRKAEMMEVLVAACPSFTPIWQAFLHEWRNDVDDPPLYLALADFARHLIRMLELGETMSFREIFDAVERLHTEGDHYVQEAATVGLLEDLQNENLHTSTNPEQFRPFLGAESQKWWDKLYGFRDRGELLTDD